MAVSPPRRRRRRSSRPGRRLLAHDRELGVRFVAGADEAGRGSLAGPLVAAGVCLDMQRLRGRRCAALGLLDDSKRHTAERRDALFAAVMESATQVAVIVIPATEIDRRGLHRSNLSALGRALCALDHPEPDVCMTDGFSVPGCPRPHRAVVGGDGRSAAIAAASIVAKVTRDRFMHRIAPDYPEFSFDRHVGYITAEHTRAVREHGPTPLHRRSFEAIAYAQLDLDLGL
jgi:ribonuclease HII